MSIYLNSKCARSFSRHLLCIISFHTPITPQGTIFRSTLSLREMRLNEITLPKVTEWVSDPGSAWPRVKLYKPCPTLSRGWTKSALAPTIKALCPFPQNHPSPDPLAPPSRGPLAMQAVLWVTGMGAEMGSLFCSPVLSPILAWAPSPGS